MTRKSNPGCSDASPGFFRRFAAICYDALLLIAVLFFATALILPFNSGEAFTSNQIYYPAYLLLVSFFYFGWFWTHGGQTIGMRSWKVRILNDQRQPISWRQAVARFLWSIVSWLACGLGYLWIFADRSKRAWHDRLSHTRLFVIDKTT